MPKLGTFYWKPCPFCGGKTRWDGGPKWVWCAICRAKCPPDMWNNRMHERLVSTVWERNTVIGPIVKAALQDV